MGLNIDKFNWRQMFNDSQGKTLASLFCGTIGVLTGCGGFILSGTTMLWITIFEKGTPKDANVVNFLSTQLFQCIALITISAALLGTQIVSKDKAISEDAKPKEEPVI